ncbi:glycoside hydrolase clan GH-D [Xylanimonas cellulosilytica DSM 15894]|uniref:alpha-galactosidase n=1 Tax=Xylanimonas cellulosilytica (strain DSM 15894 / JCM 12276 / CECT 5975 / KCTC 9989 / LMG 20990 / NBRC 107835 / XIL07) TaxID=446471 RepID=D1BUQ8_XYLCX|nr:alpha-galactosidase [Xylanimonas cellulosilytica]ACZ29299.1 glycoside hydrolase clan GH-D [Xylanimonas cellulosilytica DSM 15894]
MVQHIALRGHGVGIVVSVPDVGLPAVVHWGADLGDLDSEGLAALDLATARQTAPGTLDAAWRLPLLPQESDGWSGRPGLLLARDGRPVFPRWQGSVTMPDGGTPAVTADGGMLVVTADDAAAGLALVTRLRIADGGLVLVDHELTNTGDGELEVVHVEATLPVPRAADTLTSFGGRWNREKTPTTAAMPRGTWLRESRRGRPGHDQPWVTLASAGAPRHRSGEVWAVHLGWSADVRHRIDRVTEHVTLLGAGELLRPHEVRLVPGDTYRTPTAYFAWSDAGLDGISDRFHTHLRARARHPRTPRPLVLNTWEAVYFDHDPARLEALARQAARVGVERFVLDDGWFLGRRDDTTSLGDWVVDPHVYPDGLEPLAALVHDLGMQLGLWFEPEMISLDSQVARAHPDWVLGSPESVPSPEGLSFRSQYVLDLANPDAFEHVRGQMSDAIRRLGVDYVKWDHNRDLVEAVHHDPSHTGRPGTRAQTLAAYRLMDALRAEHPGLEIESCSSGGARTDLGVLAHTDRVWASDNNDPVDRWDVHRWTELVLPPELIGAHVGPSPAHSTHRATDLSFRAALALTGHAGLEWNLLDAAPSDLEGVAALAALYRELRGLLHTGTVVHADVADPVLRARGVVAPDRSQAVWTVACLAAPEEALAERLRLPGLDPSRSYAVRVRDDVGAARWGWVTPGWLGKDPVVVPGRVLTDVGLQLPTLWPVQALVLHLTAV